jgi:peptide chain release factor 2
MKEIEELERDIQKWRSIQSEISGLEDFVGALEEDQDSYEEDLWLAQEQYQQLKKDFQQIEKLQLYQDKFDRNSAILAIHSGAGGVDAQDWAQMLLRMYLRFGERRGYRTQILEQSLGTEAGLKSVLVEFQGGYAYGNLKSEAGTHRLVRLSPFNADNLRQTSFALVEVVPLIDQSQQKIELASSELKIDTFRSSGAGGQSVNTTDSAVRVTHLPTGIVVTCQNERSQLQNKEKALAILKSKLIQKRQSEEEKRAQELKGEYRSAEWGNQIRSYVLHPYQLVKDHRTGEQISATEKVLDGEIDNFSEAYLRGEID